MDAGSSGNSCDIVSPFPINPKWLLSEEAMMKIPTILDGIKPQEEIKHRQKAAAFMQDMGEMLIGSAKEHRVKMSFCMCVAMIHLHRFFVVHSMRIFDPRDVAAACLFLAGKSEEFPRKLELIAKAWYKLKHRNDDRARPFDQQVCEESGEFIVFLEGVVLQTIGFKLDVQLPHPLIVKYSQKFLQKSNLNEIAYFFATDMIFITNWSVRYEIETMACVCIHVTCLWANHEITQPPGSLPWYNEIDPNLTKETLDELVDTFSQIYETTDQNQLISRKRLAERNNRALLSSSRLVTPSSFSTCGSSNRFSADDHDKNGSNSANRTSFNITADATQSVSIPTLPSKPATSSHSNRSELRILPPPPVPPKLTHKREFGETKAKPNDYRQVEHCLPESRQSDHNQPDNRQNDHRQLNYRQPDSRQSNQRQLDHRQPDKRPQDNRQPDNRAQDNQQDSRPQDNRQQDNRQQSSRPPEAKQRKLTLKEYKERNAMSTSASNPSTSSSSVMRTGVPPIANGTGWMNGA